MRYIILAAALLAAGTAGAQEEKAEINIINNRSEAVAMRFDYAFRQYTWNLIRANIDANDEVTYRFPSNIPGCERLREWRITDGLLVISNARGMICQKRISLCDKIGATMEVGTQFCDWSVQK